MAPAAGPFFLSPNVSCRWSVEFPRVASRRDERLLMSSAVSPAYATRSRTTQPHLDDRDGHVSPSCRPTRFGCVIFSGDPHSATKTRYERDALGTVVRTGSYSVRCARRGGRFPQMRRRGAPNGVRSDMSESVSRRRHRETHPPSRLRHTHARELMMEGVPCQLSNSNSDTHPSPPPTRPSMPKKISTKQLTPSTEGLDKPSDG